MRRALTAGDFPLVAADCLVFGRSVGTTPIFLCPTAHDAADLATVLNAGAEALAGAKGPELPLEPEPADPQGWELDVPAKAI